MKHHVGVSNLRRRHLYRWQRRLIFMFILLFLLMCLFALHTYMIGGTYDSKPEKEEIGERKTPPPPPSSPPTTKTKIDPAAAAKLKEEKENEEEEEAKRQVKINREEERLGNAELPEETPSNPKNLFKLDDMISTEMCHVVEKTLPGDDDNNNNQNVNVVTVNLDFFRTRPRQCEEEEEKEKEEEDDEFPGPEQQDEIKDGEKEKEKEEEEGPAGDDDNNNNNNNNNNEKGEKLLRYGRDSSLASKCKRGYSYIVGFKSRISPVSYFPEEILENNDNNKDDPDNNKNNKKDTGLQRVRQVIMEREKENEYADFLHRVIWRLPSSSTPLLRCVPHEAKALQGYSYWEWNSTALTVRFSLYNVKDTIKRGKKALEEEEEKDVLEQHGEFNAGEFSFTPESRVRFYGLPSRSSGMMLEENTKYHLFNSIPMDSTVHLGLGGSGTVPLVYAIGRARRYNSIPENTNINNINNNTNTNTDANTTTSTTTTNNNNNTSTGENNNNEEDMWKQYTVGILWLNGSPLRVETQSYNRHGRTSITFVNTAGATRLYLLPGPTPEDVLQQYYTLTGFPMFPPRFALGYHHAHNDYKDSSKLIELSNKFEREHIPVDTLGVSFLSSANDQRIFTWNTTHFPDPLRLQQQLWRDGGRFLVISTVPYVRIDARFPPYLEGKDNSYFVTTDAEVDVPYMALTGTPISTSQGSKVVRGCMGAWIDFLSPSARHWYSGLLKYKRFIGSTNHTFLSLEGNTPIVEGTAYGSLPMKTGHMGAVQHAQVHNVYGMLHAMAAFNGQLRRTHFYRRPFVITESFFAGIQRYAAVRIAPYIINRDGKDEQGGWKGLQESVETCLTHSIAGIPFVGVDVGGFWYSVEEELLLRWYQLGVFLPFFRSNAAAGVPLRESWDLSPSIHARIRDAIQFRYTLLPTLYTLFWRSHFYGELIMRPLFFVYPEEELTRVEPIMLTQQFFLGPDLFVAPVLTPLTGVEKREGRTIVIHMPPEDLYNYWTGTLVKAHSIFKTSIEISYSLLSESLMTPLFQRVGSIVSTYTDVSKMRSTHDVANYTLTIALPSLMPILEKQQKHQTHLLARGELFLDDGSSYVNYHEKKDKNNQVHCVMLFECILMPDSNLFMVRWRPSSSSSSSCREVRNRLQSDNIDGSIQNGYYLTRLRLLFAAEGETGILLDNGKVVDNHGDLLTMEKVTPHIVEIADTSISFLSEDDDDTPLDQNNNNNNNNNNNKKDLNGGDGTNPMTQRNAIRVFLNP